MIISLHPENILLVSSQRLPALLDLLKSNISSNFTTTLANSAVRLSLLSVNHILPSSSPKMTQESSTPLNDRFLYCRNPNIIKEVKYIAGCFVFLGGTIYSPGCTICSYSRWRVHGSVTWPLQWGRLSDAKMLLADWSP